MADGGLPPSRRKAGGRRGQQDYVASWVGLRGRDLIRLWTVPILLAGVALAFDTADRRLQFSILTSGALDEGANPATGTLGLLALSCFIDVPRRFYVAGLIASVAIDLGPHTSVPRGGKPVPAARRAFAGHPRSSAARGEREPAGPRGPSVGGPAPAPSD